MADDPTLRESELFALERAIASHRLVVLTGSPGIGKSYLANAITEQARRRKPGHHFAGAKQGFSVTCRLDGAGTTPEVVDEIGRALGLATASNIGPEVLADRIGRTLASRRRVLVVLDDADRARRVLAKLIPRWLEDAKGAAFVVTARNRLGITGEHRLEVGPLDVPAAREKDLPRIAASPAVQLFVRRAVEVRPGYRLTQESGRTVAKIVRKLEGVPLAIELSAARMRALSEQHIADLLAERLDLLEDTATARSIRSAFNLSWVELDPADAQLLAACACFRGGFLLDAACAVSGLGPDPSAREKLAVGRSLERLMDASLVRLEEGPGGERRYTLSETLRAFAAEKLSRSGDVSAIKERHAAHYAGLRARTPRPSLDALAAERKNLEEAFDRSIRLYDPRSAEVLLAYAPVALARGPLAPFVDRASRALADITCSSEDRGELLLARGLARIFQGKRDEGSRDLEEAASEARRAGADRVLAIATSKLAVVIGLGGEIESALPRFDAALGAATRDGDPRTEGIVRKDLANVLSEAGRNDDAIVELVRARTLLRSAGDVREEGFVLMMLGTRFVDDGRLKDARRDLTAALGLLRKVGDLRTEAYTMTMLALVDAEEGVPSRARDGLDLAREIVRQVGDEATEGLIAGILGNIALEQGLLEEAEATYADALALLEQTRDRGHQALFGALLAVVEHALGRIAAARDRLQRARRLVVGDGRAARRRAIEILASVIERSPVPPPVGREVEEIRLARKIVAKLGRADTPGPSLETGLVVANDGSWVRLPSGVVTRLGAGRPVARVIHRLALERVRHPGKPVPPPALVRAGWPDERLLPEAAKNRLHVTIARLRRVALDKDLLLHDGEGYFLDPKEPVRLADPGETPPGTGSRGSEEPLETPA